VVILSTFYDLRTKKFKGVQQNEFIVSFSFYTNGKNYFCLEQKKSTEVITCLNGIRALSILAIIFLHSFFYRIVTPFLDEKYCNEWLKTNFAATVLTLNIFVDTFFVMSGLLMTKSMLKELDE
jgi:peptidoglycan/LPS O-acetylase OafA/YrhL